MLRQPDLTMVISIVLWLVTRQMGWNFAAYPAGTWYFNPLAWQVLFVFGAWYAQDGAARLRRIVQSRIALTLAVLYLAFSLGVALSWHFKVLETFMPDVLSRLIYPIDKSSLSPWRLLHFLSLAIVAVHLSAPDWRGPMKRLLRAMIRCGENSLPMYCLGVLLSFVAHVVLVEISGSMATQVAVSLAGILLMIIAATLLTWEAKLDRRGPKLF
jgi:hypothetical protein